MVWTCRHQREIPGRPAVPVLLQAMHTHPWRHSIKKIAAPQPVPGVPELGKPFTRGNRSQLFGQFLGGGPKPPGQHLDIYPEFLAICLRASNLNRSKLGEYLPLITQEVVHKIEIPVPPKSDQSVAIDEFAQIVAAETSLMRRLSRTRSLVMQVASQMLQGSASGI